MSRIIKIISRSTILFSFLISSCSQAADPNQPNVIFIMTDDVGYGDIGSYGAPDIKTPVLDQMAADGVRFTDFYANAPVCTPTRAGFTTGRYQQRYQLESPLEGPSTAEGHGLDADGRTLPALLKNSGYSTALIGKWHLGYENHQSPNAHGYDYFYGFKSGYVDYYQHTMGRSGEADLWENETKITEDGYLTDLITQHSIEFIEEHSNDPFFLSIQYNAGHWPYQRPDMPSVARNHAAHLQPHNEDTSTREDYVAMMERADQGIGEVLAALEEAGLTENTLVVFTNDNGGEWLSRNAPLFNRKLTVWEGGIRVPAIFKWPGVIPAGVVTDQVGITMDVTATILAATSAQVPVDLNLEGINLLPILTGESEEISRTLFWRTSSQKAVRSGDMKMVMSGASNTMIFNVRDDVSERDDLTNKSQDVARRLRGLLDAWEADVNAEALERADH